MTTRREPFTSEHEPVHFGCLQELLDHLGLVDLDEFETYCEDQMELLAVVSMLDDIDGFKIQPIGLSYAIGLEFPLTLEWLLETLTQLEEATIGFA